MYKSKNTFSLMALTCHFLSPDFKLVKLVLYAEYFGKQRHTGSSIIFSLNMMLEELALDAFKVKVGQVSVGRVLDKCKEISKGWW